MLHIRPDSLPNKIYSQKVNKFVYEYRFSLLPKCVHFGEFCVNTMNISKRTFKNRMKGCGFMNNDTNIAELNALLKGTYMGIRSMEHYIEKVDDEELKRHFQSMQQETKHNAQLLAERIQNLHGVPADSEGITGAMQGYLHRMMLSEDPKEIIEDALKGVDEYGVNYSEELVKGDLDPESRQIVEEVINTNRRHADFLRHLLH